MVIDNRVIPIFIFKWPAILIRLYTVMKLFLSILHIHNTHCTLYSLHFCSLYIGINPFWYVRRTVYIFPLYLLVPNPFWYVRRTVYIFPLYLLVLNPFWYVRRTVYIFALYLLVLNPFWSLSTTKTLFRLFSRNTPNKYIYNAFVYYVKIKLYITLFYIVYRTSQYITLSLCLAYTLLAHNVKHKHTMNKLLTKNRFCF